MIRKAYEVGFLLCHIYGGQMRIISFIEKPMIIDGIIAHIDLTFEANGHTCFVMSNRNF